MTEQSKPVYQIDGNVRSEFKILEEKLMKEPKVLSREEAAKMIGVSPSTISQYVKNGLLPNRGLGRRINILESDLVKVPKKRNYTHYL